MAILDGKIALVTGASRGIGFQCAKCLAGEGAHVIAVARTVGGLEELDDAIREQGGSATLVPLDLLDHEAIDRLGLSIHERWGKLDILVANAGMLGGLSPVDHFDPKTVDKVLNLNLVSNWRLIGSMSPLLRSADHGRAVFLTCSQAREDKAFWGLYAASKAGLERLVKGWAQECKKTALRINLLDPGPMRTALRAQAFPGEDTEALAHPAEISEPLLMLASESLVETGQVFDRASGKFLP